jgi:hypothetical protein
MYSMLIFSKVLLYMATTINPTLVFNFNLNQVFNSTENIVFFQPINAETQVLVNPNTGLVGFRYGNSKVPGGLILKMATIPGEIYHIFTTGQVIVGNTVQMKVRNPCPEIHLGCDVSWLIGAEEVRSICFQALGNLTDVIFTTDKQCFCNLAPYEYLIQNMTIIPDTYMCQGYIKGTTGPTGHVGATGVQGVQGVTTTGQQGFIGPPGPQGTVGSHGFQGTVGKSGNIGGIGAPGIMGAQGPRNFQAGPTGTIGIGGSIGTVGVVGPQGGVGPQGVQGVQAYRTTGNSINVITGSTVLSWFRGGSSPVAINVLINYQQILNYVIIEIQQFVCIGSTVGGVPVSSCLTSESMPAAIRPTIGNESYFSCLITVNGVTINSVIQIGPAIMTIFSSLQLECDFAIDDVVFFPTQSFEYLL